MLSGFLLGLSSGTVCLSYCAPVLMPYLLGEGKNVKQNFKDLVLFLGGRLLGYLLFAIITWKVNRIVLEKGLFNHSLVLGMTYLLLALLMLIYTFKSMKTSCMAGIFRKSLSHLTGEKIPLIFGLLTGMNLCPPFLLAITRAVESTQLIESITFFGAFFLGTLIYFLPFPIIGLCSRHPNAQIIGKFASIIIGGYYLYSGAILLLGGIS
jgi:sulfite exporter TauE/SafE